MFRFTFEIIDSSYELSDYTALISLDQVRGLM